MATAEHTLSYWVPQFNPDLPNSVHFLTARLHNLKISTYTSTQLYIESGMVSTIMSYCMTNAVHAKKVSKDMPGLLNLIIGMGHLTHVLNSLSSEDQNLLRTCKPGVTDMHWQYMH